MKFWMQNLNEIPGPVPDRYGSILWYGRGSVHTEDRRWKLGAEWKLGGWSCGAAFGIQSEEDLGGSLRVPGVALHWHASTPLTRWLRERAGYHDLEVSFAIHDWLLTFYPWVDPMGGWRSDGRWWQQATSLHLHPREWTIWRWLRKHLGVQNESYRETLVERRVLVALPEAVTTVVFRWERQVYRDWPFTPRVYENWTAKPENPLPIPGKGENSWDCEDDAIYAMSFGTDCLHLEDAVGRLVASVYKDRLRRGGSELMSPSS